MATTLPCAPNEGGQGSNLGQGTRSQVPQLRLSGAKLKKKKKKKTLLREKKKNKFQEVFVSKGEKD